MEYIGEFYRVTFPDCYYNLKGNSFSVAYSMPFGCVHKRKKMCITILELPEKILYCMFFDNTRVNQLQSTQWYQYEQCVAKEIKIGHALSTSAWLIFTNINTNDEEQDAIASIKVPVLGKSYILKENRHLGIS